VEDIQEEEVYRQEAHPEAPGDHPHF